MPSLAGVPNPVTVTDNKVYQEHITKFRGKGEKDLDSLFKAELKEAELIAAQGFVGGADGIDYDKITCIGGTPAEKAEKISAKQSIMAAIIDAKKEKQENDKFLKNAMNGELTPEMKETPTQLELNKYPNRSLYNVVRDKAEDEGFNSAGELFNAVHGGRRVELNWNLHGNILNTLFQTGSGASAVELIETQAVPGYVDAAVRPPQILDLIPATTSNTGTLTYIQESPTVTLPAATAEGKALQEMALDTLKINLTIKEVGGHLPYTIEAEQDSPVTESFINRRVPFYVRQVVDEAIMSGNGTGDNISGITNQTAAQHTAMAGATNLSKITGRAADAPDIVAPTLDAIMKIVSNAFTFPSNAIIHPTFWGYLATNRPQNANYFLSTSPGNTTQMRVWGVPLTYYSGAGLGVAASNHAVVFIDRMMMELFYRQGLVMERGFINDDFTKKINRVRAYVRLAVAYYRPNSISTLDMPSS